MDLNLFDNKRNNNDFINEFIEELRNVLKKINKTDKEIDEFNIYEKKKIFLDNKSRKGNDLAWVMDENSVCISEDGDGGPISISKIDLPTNRKVGEVYEKVDGEYVFNQDVSNELKDIM